MPTKINRAGQQQNYVPAGNGDASGEYGDNATGSNKHFTAFEKPKDNEVKVENTEIKVEKNNDKEKSEYKNFDDYAEQFKHNEKFYNGLKESFNAGSDEQKNKLQYFVSNGIIKIAEEKKGVSNYNGRVNLNSANIQGKKGSLSKETGDTLYHEFGHAYDEFFAKGFVDKNGNTILKGLITKEDDEKIYDKYKNDYLAIWQLKGNLSTNKYLSNGKTLYETIQEEAREMSKNKIWDSIINDYKQDIENEIKKQLPSYYEEKEKLNQLDKKIEDEADKLFSPDDWRYRYPYIEEKKNSEEYIKLKEKITDLDFERHKIENNILKQYSNLSDMYGIYKKIPYGFGSGHTGNYGKNKGIIAHEFFAEYNSSLARNDEYAKKQLELYKKYMPKSLKMAEELFDLMSNAWKGINK